MLKVVTMYRGGEQMTVWSHDQESYLRAGWSLEKPVAKSAPAPAKAAPPPAPAKAAEAPKPAEAPKAAEKDK